MIDRLRMKVNVRETLERGYVALLSQRGTELNSFLSILTIENNQSMSFLSIYLPNGLKDAGEFNETLLTRLLSSLDHVPLKEGLANKIRQDIDHDRQQGRSSDFRLCKIFDQLGTGTSALYLVVILHAFSGVEDVPLKTLLTLLRDYHSQIGELGTPGNRLRFLVAGDAKLWRLCFYRNDTISPFNIAYRLFLPGLFSDDLFEANENTEIGFSKKYLWDTWNYLHSEGRDILKMLAREKISIPNCEFDPQCPQIPVVDPPWLEAFWAGFLQKDETKLIWRSLTHRAFVLYTLKGSDLMGVSIPVDSIPEQLIANQEEIVEPKPFSNLESPQSNLQPQELFYTEYIERLHTCTRSVGLLNVPKIINGEAKETPSGTGWLISNELAITCFHVIKARGLYDKRINSSDLKNQVENATLIFEYTIPGTGIEYEVKVMECYNENLDYAILRLSDRQDHPLIGRGFLRPVEIDAPLNKQTQLLIIQHPYGQPQQNASGRFDKYLEGMPNQFLYSSLTRPGTSGAPVLNTLNWRVVALHNGEQEINVGAPNAKSVPLGTLLKAILNDIKQQNNDLYNEIVRN